MVTGSPGFLETLIGHEAAVGRLYRVFSETFPDRAEFWQGLATEEEGHADRLRELGSDPIIDDWLARESGLRPQAVRSSIAYVESQIERARGGGLGVLQALVIARDLESALIEEQFARMGRSLHVAASPVLAELAAETEAHRALLTAALEAERRSSPGGLGDRPPR